MLALDPTYCRITGVAINEWQTWGPKIRASVTNQQLPCYRGQAGIVDYTNAREQFALNAALLYNVPMVHDHQANRRLPRPHVHTEVLVAQRGSGDGVIGSWSGVSGFIDVVNDPAGGPDENFDLITHTVRAEFREEGGMTDEDLDKIEWFVGPHDVWPAGRNGSLYLLPMVGVWQGDDKPTFKPDGHELTAHAWVPIHRLKHHPDLADDFLEHTLAKALYSLMHPQAAHQLVGSKKTLSQAL